MWKLSDVAYWPYHEHDSSQARGAKHAVDVDPSPRQTFQAHPGRPIIHGSIGCCQVCGFPWFPLTDVLFLCFRAQADPEAKRVAAEMKALLARKATTPREAASRVRTCSGPTCWALLLQVACGHECLIDFLDTGGSAGAKVMHASVGREANAGELMTYKVSRTRESLQISCWNLILKPLLLATHTPATFITAAKETTQSTAPCRGARSYCSSLARASCHCQARPQKPHT